MQECLYSEFFKNKPADEAELLEFGKRCSIPVENNLKAIRDRTEFLAEIIEYRFGNLLSKSFTDLKHEYSIFPDSPYTPDWTMKNGSETIVAEVLRLNPAQKDAHDMHYSDKLAEVLGELKKDFLLKLEYKFEQLSEKAQDLQAIKSFISKWIEGNPERYAKVSYNDEINFTVFRKDEGLTKVNTLGPYRSIDFDYRRLTGERSRLFSKLKYADELVKHDIPYLVCMHLTFESWFDPEDLFQRLYGMSGSFHHDEPFEEFYPGAVFHDISEGLYYTNDLIKNCISGILVYYQGHFSYFPNYSNCNRLSNKSQELLKQHLYKDLKG
ncbi:hypothetical protein QG516_03445 [Pedobacter gandavensis]|uniref:hypothetical protein n=1 Tax=Pedobacter gandavensis TaxID=2679963 RepID=UPI00247B1E4F|nr:hypothetical protein [Pedobacter gandavensis]WGQ10709.1 hypothetical protein QG516_03445 [Pedobacter gandavensis]